MTPLSPLDALGPAFRRTREVLATPFRLGFFLKIALIAALTQPSFYSAMISYPIDGAQFAFLPHGGHHSVGHFVAAPGLAAFGLIALVVAGVILVALWIFFAYLYCRLRFTLFDLVVYKRGLVGKAWSAYGRQSWRYFGMVILVSLGFLVIAAIIVGPTLLNFIRAVRPLATSGGNPNPFAMLGAMLPFLLAVIFVAALWAVVDSLMQDFLLPPMAIEDAPLESAFARFFSLLKQSFGAVIIYVLLRFAVGIGLSWILMLVLLAALIVVGFTIFGLGTLLYHALWASMVGQVICIALAIIVGLVVIAVYLMAIIAIYGISAVFKQSYAAYFFGGRYPALGDRLDPQAAAEESGVPEPPATSPPLSFPPLEEAPPVW